MLGTIINFSTNEAQFLRHCLEEAGQFSDQVIVSVCDHFFGGEKENIPLLYSIYADHPNVQFIQYEWSEKNFYASHSNHYWHNLGRLLGMYFLDHRIEYILFLDVDEIIEAKPFLEWLKNFPLKEYSALYLACYWYFREVHWRAKSWENSPLITSKAALHYDHLMHPEERAGTFFAMERKKKKWILGSDQKPMVHHYSWVRNKEQMLKKVRNWGHCLEYPWEELVEREFSHPFSGKDFVYGYSYEKVSPYLKPSHYSFSEKEPQNVTKLSTGDIHKIDLRLKFGL